MPHIASFFFLWFFQTSPRRASQIPSLIHAHSYVATSPVGFQSLVSILCSLELISSTPLRLQEQEPIVTLMNSFLLPLFRGFLPLSDVLFHFISTIFFLLFLVLEMHFKASFFPFKDFVDQRQNFTTYLTRRKERLDAIKAFLEENDVLQLISFSSS